MSAALSFIQMIFNVISYITIFKSCILFIFTCNQTHNRITIFQECPNQIVQ